MPIPACIFLSFLYPSIVFMHVFHMSMDVNLHKATQSIEHEKVINGLVACQKLCKIAAETRHDNAFLLGFLIAIYLFVNFYGFFFCGFLGTRLNAIKLKIGTI